MNYTYFTTSLRQNFIVQTRILYICKYLLYTIQISNTRREARLHLTVHVYRAVTKAAIVIRHVLVRCLNICQLFTLHTLTYTHTRWHIYFLPNLALILYFETKYFIHLHLEFSRTKIFYSKIRFYNIAYYMNTLVSTIKLRCIFQPPDPLSLCNWVPGTKILV